MPKKSLKANQSTLNLSETAEKPPLQRRSSAKTQQEQNKRLQAVAPKRHSITALPQAAKEKLNAKKQVTIFRPDTNHIFLKNMYLIIRSKMFLRKRDFDHFLIILK